jgi:uncharacterized membrane protein
MARREWWLRKNCSLSPRQTALVYGGHFMLAAAIGTFFTLRGAWPVLVYSLIENGALAAALLLYARHAGDHEHIVLSDDCLLVESVDGARRRQATFAPYWTHVAMPRRAQPLLLIESKGVRLGVGRFVAPVVRRRVGRELREALRARGRDVNMMGDDMATGTGDAVCDNCEGSGKVDGKDCPMCGGTGKVIEGIGGG